MLKKFILSIIVLFLVNGTTFSFEIKKIKNPIHLKKKPQKTKMVETEDEWKIQAQNVPLSERKIEEYKPQTTTKEYFYPKEKYRFEKYNYPQGTKETDISYIKNDIYTYSDLVADENCRYGAYAQYFYSPDINQISSNFYIGKLDTSKTKVKRMLDFSPEQADNKLILEAGTKERYPNLFNGLTLVDWNKSANKLLIKEKVGSTVNGIYRTYIYIHYMENGFGKGYTVKLLDLDDAIKRYLSYRDDVDLDSTIYELAPLGFSAENDSLIILNCYLYDKNNKRIFMGVWGYNCDSYEVILISKTNPEVELSTNGLVLKRVID